MILIMIAATFLLVKILHESGHFLAAKSLGFRTEAFRIGKGPSLVSVNKTGTKLSLCLFPIGSKVVLHPANGEWWKRAIVVLGGPISNFIVAAIFLMVAAGIYTIPSSEPIIGKVHKIGSVETKDIQTGDRILKLNDTSVQSWEEIREIIRQSETDTYQFQLQRNGQEMMAKVVSPAKQELIFSLSPMQTRSPIEALKYNWMLTENFLESTYYLLTNYDQVNEELNRPIYFNVSSMQTVVYYFNLWLLYASLVSNIMGLLSFLPFYPFDGGRLVSIFFKALRKNQKSH